MKAKNQRVLFITKLSQYGTIPYTGYEEGKSFTGLSNSINYISDLLNSLGYTSKVVSVVDNNDIDRVVTQFKATHVFIEALWVVPEKFKELIPLHPNVKWVIRLHSEIPFIAQEGMAMDWISRYQEFLPNVTVAANSARMAEDLQVFIENSILYLPNYYPVVKHTRIQTRTSVPGEAHIGCFGAIRPLKNQLEQAIAAIKFANQIERKLVFHINSGRIELMGESVLKNIRALFEHQDKHVLVEHPWMGKEDFLKIVAQMDIVLQMSLSESFNIVTADAVALNVPVVVSPEISWCSKLFQASPTDIDDIVCKMKRAWYGSYIDLQQRNKKGLLSFDKASKLLWTNYLSA